MPDLQPALRQFSETGPDESVSDKQYSIKKPAKKGIVSCFWWFFFEKKVIMKVAALMHFYSCVSMEGPVTDQMKTGKKKNRILFTVILSLLALLLGGLITGGILMLRFDGNVRSQVTIETGGSLPGLSDFLEEDSSLARLETDLGTIDTQRPGVYPVEIGWGPFTKTATLAVRDTVAPTGEARNIDGKTGEIRTAEDFIVWSEDVTEVTPHFVATPDFEKEGTREVELFLEDEGGNRTYLSAEMTLYDPDIRPKLCGLEDKTIYTGESVAYRPGVTVEDVMDPDVQFTIDNSRVNLDQPGDYTVIYTATDRYGRTGSDTIQVHVVEPPENYADMLQVEALADQVLSELLYDGMTDIEKAFAIYVWVRKNVPWNGARTVRDEVEEALEGLQGHSGDCYTHMVTCKKLLDKAGIENIQIERWPGPGKHYWLMVKIDGEWYHMDPSPIYTHKHIGFLETDIEVERFSLTVRPNYYAFDHDKYPATPLQSPARATYKNGNYRLEYTE